MAPFINDAHIDLGYRYRSAAIFTEPGDDGAITEDPRQMRGRPGTRLPHVLLERDGARGVVDRPRGGRASRCLPVLTHASGPTPRPAPRAMSA